jgi:hypothetical protein
MRWSSRSSRLIESQSRCPILSPPWQKGTGKETISYKEATLCGRIFWVPTTNSVDVLVTASKTAMPPHRVPRPKNHLHRPEEGGDGSRTIASLTPTPYAGDCEYGSGGGLGNNGVAWLDHRLYYCLIAHSFRYSWLLLVLLCIVLDIKTIVELLVL